MKSNILANRLADITAMAYAGQSLNIAELAEKYQVSTKTIRRDFDRLCAILERCPDTGNYILSASARSQYNEQDLVRLIDDFGLKKALRLKLLNFFAVLLMTQPATVITFKSNRLRRTLYLRFIVPLRRQ
ncbi:DeoR family transcriptional regulator [Vibrio nigripulchritudo]|uniref:DeoR family transcriptional regulator n=1 Tax=Vibrio nigripulchritudo TaxID=28173 RepID=UPI002492810D|nr:DeoR family transcriptional regulator [Vibrio nigripulchritudo]